MKPIPIPAQVPAKDAVAQVPDSRLWYWDTGGSVVPIVLLHPPATGSALIWGYQQPVFAKAGYRVIAYSRRGYYNSAPYDKTILVSAPRTFGISPMSWALNDFMCWRRRPAAASLQTSGFPTRTGS